MEIIHTNNTKTLASALAEKLALPMFCAHVQCYNSGEISVSLFKRFLDVVLVASTVTHDDWMKLFLLLDALRDSKNIVLVLSYMGYSRQDICDSNKSFGAGLFPRLLETANISHCIVFDNHCEPFFRIPTVHVSSAQIFASDIMGKYDADKITIVSPDIGGARRAGAVARFVGSSFAICHKMRDVFGLIEKSTVVGDVSSKICVLIDDIIDSGATLYAAADALMRANCAGVVSYCSHGILSGEAVEKLDRSEIAEITLTDSIERSKQFPVKFKKLSIASLIAEEIQCILQRY
ncbi:MAG: ribose-phosphate diphosphokinase [Holosporaceae bacterium]|jgi:ribose-phosphate pyrophosphokinase|nr:ribose-phosphate diphosphokinase [Holosporaceae bacterium]